MTRIEFVKEELHDLVKNRGLSDGAVLEKSRELDKLITEFTEKHCVDGKAKNRA